MNSNSGFIYPTNNNIPPKQPVNWGTQIPKQGSQQWQPNSNLHRENKASYPSGFEVKYQQQSHNKSQPLWNQLASNNKFQHQVNQGYYSQTKPYNLSHQNPTFPQNQNFLNQSNAMNQKDHWGTKNEANLFSHSKCGPLIKNLGFTNPENNSHRNQQNHNFPIQLGVQKLITFDRMKRYRILSCMDQTMALDVSSVTDPNKKIVKGNLIIWQYHGGPNQTFYISPEGKNLYRLYNAASGYPIKIPNGDTKQGAHGQENPLENAKYELFQIEQFKGGKKQIYTIKTFCGLVLDCQGVSTKNGTRVIQYQFNGGKNQLWRIVPA